MPSMTDEVARDADRRRRRTRRLVSVAVFGLLLAPGVAVLLVAAPGGSAANAAAAPVYAQAAQASLATAGRQLYVQYCSACHGSDAGGTAQGPAIAGLGPANYDFQMSTGRMPLAEPGTQAVRGTPVLTHAQIQAVIAYLVALNPGGVPIPPVDTAAGSLSQGSALYLGNCAPCHASSGNGGAVGPRVAPELHQATPLQIAEAIRVGPGTMPVFGSDAIDQQELNSLVRYVLYLRGPEHPGGLSMGEFGPIVEGFVALAVGIALAVVVTRYIGSRA
jgi:ubiquinol-cytochrome c reductase cytochrome c subunit